MMDERLQRIKFLRDQCAARHNRDGLIVTFKDWLNRPAERYPRDREYTNIQWILDGDIDRVLLSAEGVFDTTWIDDEF